MAYPELYLKKNEDKRLRKGHVWVFSNEVDTHRSPLDQFAPGDLVNVVTEDGKPVGTAYVNPQTLIAARLLSRKLNLSCGINFFKARLTTALRLREQLFNKPYYRLIFGESDGLPGLVIDRFDRVFSVQITSAGIEKHKPFLMSALIELFNPEAIVFKNENSQRALEGLSQENEIGYGKLPESLVIEENGVRFAIDILTGQKTGWFYDHRNSRRETMGLCRDRTVLDLFSYTGAWAIPAAKNGAQHVTCVDASAAALALASENARLNEVEQRVECVQSDVFDFLKTARSEKRSYDIIVLDPPALIKRKKDFKHGFEAYRRLNDMALQILSPNGILISASCSHHLSRDNLHELLRASARHIDRHLTIFGTGGQGPDHPVHPGMPETEYLKTYFCYVSPSL